MKEYKIEFLKTAEKEIAKLPRKIQERIAKKINTLITNPYPADVKSPLQIHYSWVKLPLVP